jgi:hypothetical protein
VQDIQQAIATIEGLTKQLTSGQVDEPPAQVETELNQLAAEMIKEREKLAAAEAALNDCRKGAVIRKPGFLRANVSAWAWPRCRAD